MKFVPGDVVDVIEGHEISMYKTKKPRDQGMWRREHWIGTVGAHHGMMLVLANLDNELLLLMCDGTVGWAEMFGRAGSDDLRIMR